MDHSLQEEKGTYHSTSYVFNVVMHLDEATSHLHIDYIPLGHFSRGLEVRNTKNKALDEMGFGNDAHSNNRWRLREWEVLKDICNVTVSHALLSICRWLPLRPTICPREYLHRHRLFFGAVPLCCG